MYTLDEHNANPKRQGHYIRNCFHKGLQSCLIGT